MQQTIRMIDTCTERPSFYHDFGLERFLDEARGYGYNVNIQKGSKKNPKLISLTYRSHLKGVIQRLVVDTKKGLIMWETPLNKGELVGTCDYYTAYREMLNMLT